VSAVAAGPAVGPLAGKRILIAKPGLDGHDAGAKVIALALRDAGAEVIYTGLRKSPGFIVRVALDEDVAAVGLSILSGSHLELAHEVLEGLRASGAGAIPVFIGGTIPPQDHAVLFEAGVKGVYTNDMPLARMIEDLARVLA